MAIFLRIELLHHFQLIKYLLVDLEDSSDDKIIYTCLVVLLHVPAICQLLILTGSPRVLTKVGASLWGTLYSFNFSVHSCIRSVRYSP